MKKIKLWKWEDRLHKDQSCMECWFEINNKLGDKCDSCDGTWKEEKPEPEFIEVEVGNGII